MDRAMVEKALKVCEQNKKLFKDLDISRFDDVCNEVKKALYSIKLKEDYGILCVNRSMVRCSEFDVHVAINDNMYIASMGEKYRRTISWSADGKQPIDEVMLVLHFPTGAYIFGDSYPVELFAEMWAEFKTYEFKYVDDVNKCIYFSLDKAANIANQFNDILKKYYKKYRDEANVRRAATLRLELEKLEETISK